MKNVLKFRVWNKIDNKFFSQDILNKLPLEVFLASEHIQQYTGLSDAAGKEIYEGDFIKFTCRYNYTDKTCEVIKYGSSYGCIVPIEHLIEEFWHLNNIVEQYYPVVVYNNFELP